MRNMKKWIVTLLACGLTLSLTSCGSKPEGAAGKPEDGTGYADSINILVYPDYVSEDVLAAFEKEYGIKVNITYIVFTAKRMNTNEMTLKPLAEPVTTLRLHKPVFPLVAVDIPGIEVTRQIKRPFWSETHFSAKIYGQSRIIQQIGFYRNILSPERYRTE